MVTREHPSREEIELYAIGAGEDVVFPDIEAHFASCEGCEAALRKESRLDLAIAEVTAAIATCPACAAPTEDWVCARCGACARAGGYRMERILSEEDGIRTYVARRPGGPRVMIKELAFRTAPSIVTVAAFEKEALLLRQLAHPSIPRYLESFEAGRNENKRLYLVHEMVDGERLSDLLEHHRFSEREVLSIARGVLEALVYLHTLSPPIYHRDIRPANLIRRPDGRVVLTSFGSARDLSVTSAGTIVGLFGYVPANQLVGLVDETSDLYALGASLIHLLTRRPPWKDEQLSAALRRVHVSDGTRRFLEKLVAPHAAGRFPSARAALEAFAPAPAAPRRNVAMILTAIISGVFLGVAGTTIHFSNVRRPAVTREAQAIPAALPRMGKLLLDSAPSGAEIWLDDRPMLLDNGEVARTPSDISGLRYGSTYTISMRRTGHETFERSLVMGSHMDGATIKPRLVPAPGRLIFTVEGASRPVRIFVGEDYAGTTVPGAAITFEVLSHEAAKIEADAEEGACEADPVRVRVEPGETRRVVIRCRAESIRQR